MKPIPLMIVTGFLGAGKTTVLNRILHGDHGLKIAVMVNDFGAVNIDAQLVVDIDIDDDLVSLANGCICCTIRGDLVSAVLEIAGRDDPPDYIVIETSGVSDPIDVVLTLRPVSQIKIDSVLTVIDAEQVMETYEEYEVLTLNQIGTADLVLLNKVDLVDTPKLDSVREFVQRIAPKARIVETVQGNAPLDVLLASGTYDPLRLPANPPQDVHIHGGDHAHEHSDHALVFDTWHWHSDKALSRKALQRVIDRLPLTIYRAKGIVYLADAPDERGLVHVVGKRAEIALTGEEWGNQTPFTQTVLIGAHGCVDAKWLQAQFDSCLADNGGAADVRRLAKRAWGWLRNQGKVNAP